MLEQAFNEVYTKFKLNFYRRIFRRFQDREASLTAVETFCVEAIYALGRPSINELARFLEISAPNATYKVGSLVRKGYIRRVQSTTDKREYYLEVSDKFLTYYGVSYDYLKTVTDRIRTRFSPAEVEQLERMLTIV
ncbi:MAG: MarR family transcriptional regulator, partial [Oscillospiraceae bacterium]